MECTFQKGVRTRFGVLEAMIHEGTAKVWETFALLPSYRTTGIEELKKDLKVFG